VFITKTLLSAIPTAIDADTDAAAPNRDPLTGDVFHLEIQARPLLTIPVYETLTLSCPPGGCGGESTLAAISRSFTNRRVHCSANGWCRIRRDFYADIDLA